MELYKHVSYWELVFYHMATIHFDEDTSVLQVEAAVSEREKLLLVKISELQARSVHCGRKSTVVHFSHSSMWDF